MFKKDLFRLVAIPALAVVGVVATNQAVQAGYCVPAGNPYVVCAQYYDPNFGYICINNPAEGTGYPGLMCYQ